MKRGQLLAQPFIYISTLIVAALIIIFGVRGIATINEERQNIELTTFITSLRDNVNTYYNFDEGSLKKLNLPLPENVNEVCFYNKDKQINAPTDEIVKTLMELDTINNVFLLPLGENIKSEFNVPNLKNINDNPLCIKVKGKLNAVIETKIENNKVYVEIKNG